MAGVRHTPSVGSPRGSRPTGRERREVFGSSLRMSVRHNIGTGSPR